MRKKKSKFKNVVCWLDLIEPVHGRKWKVQATVHAALAPAKTAFIHGIKVVKF
jgi:hypothetical protein